MLTLPGVLHYVLAAGSRLSPALQHFSLSLSRHLRPPPATRVETAPAADAFTSFGGFYPEQRQSSRISPAPIKPTFLCQLSPLSLWHVWGGKLLDEI